MDEYGIQLFSAAPIDDGLRKYNVIYYIAFTIGFFLSLINGIAFLESVFLGVVASILGFAIKYNIARTKMYKLRYLEFKLFQEIEYPDIYNNVSMVLRNANILIERNMDGNPVFICNKIYYDLICNTNCTFSLWWRFSIGKAFFGERFISDYRRAVVDMGLIAYTIQQVNGGFHMKDDNGGIEKG